jgi:hypothetical protein
LVERTGGSGDLGCDVIGTPVRSNVGSWDLFQCKHYNHPLRPAEAWIELGKVCYFSYTGAYVFPRRYYFVAPQGIGTTLARLLKQPAHLKALLLAEWDKHCAKHLVTGKHIALDGGLRAHIDGLDFARFSHIPTQRLIEEHAKTRYFIVRFGLGLPQRSKPQTPPAAPTAEETRYIRQLMDAYADHLRKPVATPADLDAKLGQHFARSRERFYCAESLRNFSRDTLPEGTFEALQQQIFDGVVDVCEATHACGFTRVTATTAEAGKLDLTSSALLGRVDVADRHGICHQLANEDRLTWVPTDG